MQPHHWAKTLSFLKQLLASSGFVRGQDLGAAGRTRCDNISASEVFSILCQAQGVGVNNPMSERASPVSWRFLSILKSFCS